MSGCGVVFRTGTRLAQELEVIRGPEAVSSGPSGRGGCGLTIEANTDRYAGDYQTLSTTNPEACCEACEGDARCQAFGWVESQRTCYLKSTAPAARSAGGIASGVKKTGGATVSGVRYRIENFVYNSPDVYQNPRNFHDFVVDFRGCRIQPLNPVYAAGQEEIRVLVCRERSRLTFPSRTPGSFVEYDWVFTNNGQTIHGAYRQGGSFGPLVGGIYRVP